MKPWIKSLLVFLAGLLLGGAVSGLYISHHLKHPGLTRNNYEHILNRLSSKLRLTPDQREKVGALLEADVPKVEAAHKETNDKLEALRNSFSAHLRLFLNADQQKKLDELEANWKKHAQEGKN